MPALLPKLSSSISWRVLAIAVVPVLLVGIIGWALLLHAARLSARAEHERATASLATQYDQHLNAVQSILLHTLYSADSVGRGQRDEMLSAALRSTNSLHALLIISAEGTVRHAVMRSDVDNLRGSFAGLDFSRLLGSMPRGDSAAAPAFVQGPDSPVDGRPILAASRQLASGETLLALVDAASIAHQLVKGRPEQSWIAITTRDSSTFMHADSGAQPLLADWQNATPDNPPGSSYSADGRFLVAAAPVSSGLQLLFAAPPQLAISASYPLIAIGSALAAAVIAGIIAVVAGLKIARPISSLDAQLKEAIARQTATDVPPQPFVETESIAHTARQLVIGCRDTQDRLATIQQAIQSAAMPLSRAPGSSVVAELASALASVTNARCVLIAEWVPGFKPRARVLTAHTNVPLPADFSYELSGHPSQQVLTSPLVYVRSRVLREYPESPLLRLLGAEGYLCVPLMMGDGSIGGHLEIIDDHDIVLTDSIRDLLTLFSARATGELERIRAQRLLRERETMYQTVTLDQNEPVCRWAADTTLTFVNDAFCRAAGQSRETLLGRSLPDMLHEEDRELLLRRVRALNAASAVDNTELRMICGEGPRWQRWTSRALLDEKGRITEYQATAQDITALHELDAALADASLRFSILAENSPVAFWVTDWTTQRCIYINSMFPCVWGIPADAVREATMAWTSVVHEEDRAQIVRKYLLHAPEGQYQETYRIVRPDGTTAIIRDRAIPMRDPEGHVHRIANIAYELHPQPADVAT